MSGAATIRRMVGAEMQDGARHPDDWYATDADDAIPPLLAAERFGRNVWEFAAGDGVMARALARGGHRVVATDLVRRRPLLHPVQPGVDFLAVRRARARQGITNPPYDGALIELFIRHALLTLRLDKLALLLRWGWYPAWHHGVVDQLPPVRIHCFTWRVQMYRGGDRALAEGLIDFAWYVWEQGFRGRTEINRLRRGAT